MTHEGATCDGAARWHRASRKWLGYDLAVWGEHDDDESNWYDVDDLHRSHGGSMETMPEELRAQPDRFRDPATWCSAPTEAALVPGTTQVERLTAEIASYKKTLLHERDCERVARDWNERQLASAHETIARLTRERDDTQAREQRARDSTRRKCAKHAKARASEDARRIVMHLTRSLALCDHVGDGGNAVIDLWAALGMGEPPDDGEGFDIEAIETLLGCEAGLYSAAFEALAAKVRER